MTNDSGLFVSEDFFDANWTPEGNAFVHGAQKYLPLYEGRMIDNYDHRLASTARKEIKLQRSAESVVLRSSQKADPACIAKPRYWVSEADVRNACAAMLNQGWVLGFMDITSATNARTMIASLIPQSEANAYCGILPLSDRL